MPTLVDRYQLGEMLYSDTTVVAYRAYDPLLNRAVTIELLHAQRASDPRYVEQLLEKARQAALVRLPHVAALYDQQTVNERPFLVFEAAAGPALAEIAPLDADQAIALVQAIADTLRAAITRQHPVPVINEQTIHVGPEGRVQILDFGLNQVAVDQTQAVTILGHVLHAALSGAHEATQAHPLRTVAERASAGQYASLDTLLAELRFAQQRARSETSVLPAAVRPAPDEDDRPISRPASGPLPTLVPRPPRRRSWAGVIAAGIGVLAMVLGGVVLANRADDQLPGAPNASTGELVDGSDRSDPSTSPGTNTGSGDRYVVSAIGSTTLVVRDGPGLNARRITSLSNGTVVEVLSQPQPADNYNWVRIRADGLEGWCILEGLKRQ